MNQPTAIERLTFDTHELVTAYPPVWRHPNKRAVHAIACPPGAAHRGTLRYSRWKAAPLPEHAALNASPTRLVACPGFFDYAPVLPTADGVEWHVNFADPHLFVAYGSPLFAQDEMQVAEHPALGSLKEALEARGHRVRTMEGDDPTPVLVTGIERRCRVATEPDGAAGRPHGLYGNAFARASEDTVRAATTRLDPPTNTHLIAMAAPGGGSRRYAASEIEQVLATAFTAFSAAIAESERVQGARGAVAVHTGFWGCGAFGGHRVLMTALQIVAARMAGLDVLAFHYGDDAGARAFRDAEALLARERSAEAKWRSRDLIDTFAALGFEWGVSDGN